MDGEIFLCDNRIILRRKIWEWLANLLAVSKKGTAVLSELLIVRLCEPVQLCMWFSVCRCSVGWVEIDWLGKLVRTFQSQIRKCGKDKRIVSWSNSLYWQDAKHINKKYICLCWKYEHTKANPSCNVFKFSNLILDIINRVTKLKIWRRHVSHCSRTNCNIGTVLIPCSSALYPMCGKMGRQIFFWLISRRLWFLFRFIAQLNYPYVWVC